MTPCSPRLGQLRRRLCLLLTAAAAHAATHVTVAHAAAPADATVDTAILFSTPLFNLDDQPATLAPYRGQPLIINFWARWCGPCKVEIPELVALGKRNKQVKVIGLNVESNAAAAKQFAYAYDMAYPVLLTRDGGLALMQALGNPKMGLPFTITLDAQGKVVSSHLGVMTAEKLDAAARLATANTPSPAR